MKSETRFLALLRGINVGGNNIIAKEDLRQCFEDLGFESVRTYIQSGNILFRSDLTAIKELTTSIESALSERFSYEAQAVVLSRKKFRAAVAAAPSTWGEDPEQKHNALFTLRSTTPGKVLAQISAPKTEIETATVAPGVLFWSYSRQHQSKSTLMELAKNRVYKQLTVRNSNTVFKLLELFEEL